MAKCPDCGAPQGAVVPPRKGTSRASLAGLMLITAFALGTFSGLGVLLGPEPVANEPNLFGLTFPLNGTVRDENGTPVADVNVTYGSVNVSTTENGAFGFAEVPLGVVDLEFRSKTHANLTIRLFVSSAQTIDATLPPSGAEPRRVEHSSYSSVGLVYQYCGFLWLGCALLALLGGVAAYRRRAWGLALAGAIAALFVSPPLSFVVGGVAIFLLVRGKREFVRLPKT